MLALRAVEAEITRTSKNKIWQTEEVFLGKLRFLKPNYASLELHKKTDAQAAEKYLFTATKVAAAGDTAPRSAAWTVAATKGAGTAPALPCASRVPSTPAESAMPRSCTRR